MTDSPKSGLERAAIETAPGNRSEANEHAVRVMVTEGLAAIDESSKRKPPLSKWPRRRPNRPYEEMEAAVEDFDISLEEYVDETVEGEVVDEK